MKGLLPHTGDGSTRPTLTSPSRSGVFQQATDRRVERFTESISFDHRLYAHDIAGSIAHAQMLAAVGLISDTESRLIEATLQAIRQEIEDGRFEYRVELEDIHMHIEQELVGRLGDVGRKLHTGRSRNDQVSTDLRLWVRDALDRVDERLVELQKSFVGRCDRDADVILPAYTHLQRAQPVLAAHYWLAYCEKLERDRQRLADCRKRVNVCSLGVRGRGRNEPADRPPRRGPPAGVRRGRSQQLGRVQRSGFRLGIRVRPDADCRASEHLGGGVDSVVDGGIQLPQAAAGVLHRFVDHAPEDQSGRAGIDARQDGPRRGRSADVAGVGQGLAAGLQPGFAGGQAGAVRRVRHGGSLPGVGGAAGGRSRTAASGDCRAAGPRLSGRDHVDGVPDPPRPAPANGAPPGRQPGGPGDADRACGWRICRWRNSARPTPRWTTASTACWEWRTPCGRLPAMARPPRRKWRARWRIGRSS